VNGSIILTYFGLAKNHKKPDTHLENFFEEIHDLIA
jgi:hypothetical protein